MGAAATAVWDVVGDFRGLIEAMIEGTGGRVEVEGEGVGALRTVTLGTDVLVERLEDQDDAAWRTTYSMLVTGPFPVTGYRSTIELTPAGRDRCELEWTGTFEPAGVDDDVADAAVRGVYTGAIAMLHRRFGA